MIVGSLLLRARVHGPSAGVNHRRASLVLDIRKAAKPIDRERLAVCLDRHLTGEQLGAPDANRLRTTAAKHRGIQTVQDQTKAMELSARA